MAQARRINSVKKLNGSIQCGWLINVKLCNLWDRHHFKNWDRVESREMLLMDSNGDRIVAGVHHDHFHRFNEKLIEGTSLLISNFGCAKNGERFKQCKHVFRIKFDERTTIEPGPYVDTTIFGGIHGFDFVSFDYINATKDLSKLVDVIGQIKTTSGLTMKMARGRNQHHMELHIMNERITCTAGFDENAKIDVLQPQPKSGTIDDVITWHKITIEELSTITTPRVSPTIKYRRNFTNLWGRGSYSNLRRLIMSYKRGSTVYKCTKIIEDPILIKKFENVVSPVEVCPKFADIEDDNSITNLDTSDVAILQSVSSNIPKVTGLSSIGTEYDQDDEPITPVSSIQKWKVVEIDIDDEEHQASTNKKHV
ncbi:OLC1v1000752C1 [Oldenlandia corymbosa var. corymbosa]|uniref:OLC1v1000752C1 n=1 Tax=Oldenlandia corymbosa var. corymbosa TaxID=529605 RepID=A0AAV1D3Z0_OLDCO|nr:OLC1v1000752C1 [Oldenlandia corymbosa var. corymbosa]